jgi:hypothetical protein
MATLYANASGHIIRFLQSEPEEARFPNAPSGTAVTLTFDPVVNAAVLEALNTDWNSHAVSGGVLVRNGVPVVISSAGLAFQDRQALAALREKLDADQSLSAAELRRVLRWIIRRLT